MSNSHISNADRNKSIAASKLWSKRKRLSEVHLYQFWHGDVRIGKPVEMTGYEAAQRNNALVRKFVQQLDNNSNCRLPGWRIVRER